MREGPESLKEEVLVLRREVDRLENKLAKLEDLLFNDSGCEEKFVRKAFEIIRYG